MNDGVKLLLERIKTHPEEFVHTGHGLYGANSRWHMLVQSYENYLDPQDRHTLLKAMNEVMAEKFTEAVMKELMGAEDDDPLGKSQRAQGMPLGGATQGTLSGLFTQQHQQQYQQALLAQQARTTAIQSALQNSVTYTGGASVSAPSGSITVGNTTLTDTRSSWAKFKDWLGV